MNNCDNRDIENGSLLDDILKDIDFNDISFEGIQDLEEIVTPGHGTLCCC